MNLRQKVARAIAEAKTGLDPDTRILPFHPKAVDGMTVVPPEDSIRPLWSNYLCCADAALAAVREVLETDGVVLADIEV